MDYSGDEKLSLYDIIVLRPLLGGFLCAKIITNKGELGFLVEESIEYLGEL